MGAIATARASSDPKAGADSASLALIVDTFSTGGTCSAANLTAGPKALNPRFAQ
jgi:hypothetical protein